MRSLLEIAAELACLPLEDTDDQLLSTCKKLAVELRDWHDFIGEGLGEQLGEADITIGLHVRDKR